MPSESEFARSQARGKFFISSRWGTVYVYTRRHLDGCRGISRFSCLCPCPKWIYSKPRGGGRARQESAHTSSFAEACEIARKILDGFESQVMTTVSAPPIPEPITLPALPEPAKTRHEKPRRRRGRPKADRTIARCDLVARFELASINPWKMIDRVIPAPPGIKPKNKAADKRRRFDAMMKMIEKNRDYIDVAKQRIVALRETAEKK
jgi:hypothetical protein